MIHKGMAVAWAATLTSLGVADWLLDRRHDGSTLSECTRFAFRTHTSIGRAAFTVALIGGAVAFHQHIVKEGTR